MSLIIIATIIVVIFLSVPLRGLQIEDGKGSGSRVGVSENRLLVKALVESDLSHSAGEGHAYSWASGTYDPDAGDTILLVKNTSKTFDLHITQIWISTDVETRAIIHLPTSEVTVTGTAISGINLNTGSSNVAEASAARNETNNTQGDIVWSGEVQATSDPYLLKPLGALIIAKNKSIGVDLVSAATAADITIWAHFEHI